MFQCILAHRTIQEYVTKERNREEEEEEAKKARNIIIKCGRYNEHDDCIHNWNGMK